NNADNSIVTGNLIGNSSGASYGIIITSVDYCTCTGNIIQNTQYGVSFSGSTNNRLSDNTVTGSSLYGIFLGANCDNNNFTGNTVANLTGTAIRVDAGTSNGNRFFLNYFINSVIYGVDNALGNAWDNGSLGNYWGDYSGPDNDLNAIGDTPYTFSMYGNDRYPVLITDVTYLVDIDGDGLNGYLEINGIANPYGNVSTDPNDPDSDDDGINDGEEVYAGVDGQVTNPNNNDTDGDTMPDLWEIQNNFDATSSLDATSDPDDDLLTTAQEYVAGTDPRDGDSDNDTILDGEEVIVGNDGYITDPLIADTDEDTFSDGVEIALGTSPLDTWAYPKPDLQVDTNWVMVNGTLNVTTPTQATGSHPRYQSS
nr:NosD domain-containing protein [Candidatus Sigynarchaeota archaeon]